VGLSALLTYCREAGTSSELIHDHGWEAVLEWTIEYAVCAMAGLPKPPMSKIVETHFAVDELWNGEKASSSGVAG
jgi:hypothetical protein